MRRLENLPNIPSRLLVVWLVAWLLAEQGLAIEAWERLPQDSFRYHVWTNWQARTNGRSPQILRSVTEVAGSRSTMATNALWNTNWFFYGTENFTGMTHVKTNLGGDVWWTKKAAVISRVALLQAGHAFCANNAWQTTCSSNGVFLAVDATNGQHWRRSVGGISRFESSGQWGVHPWYRLDYCIIVLENPFPTSIAPLSMVRLADLEWRAGRGLDWPSHAACQHAMTADNASFRGTGHHAQGGDSGSPTFFVVSNRLVIGVNGQTAPSFFGSGTNGQLLAPWDQFLTDYTNALRRAGHDPARYSIRIEDMSAFPIDEQ